MTLSLSLKGKKDVAGNAKAEININRFTILSG
jgi:hypothetical protein